MKKLFLRCIYADAWLFTLFQGHILKENNSKLLILLGVC